MLVLKKIISGAQTGADQAGLAVAKEFGLETGGFIPKGHRTLGGPRPDLTALYGLKEHSSYAYNERTWDNVFHSDATVRFFWKINSAGERCTLNAIRECQKPYIDVDFSSDECISHQQLLDWLIKEQVKVLNVAGNSEQTKAGMYLNTYNFLRATLRLGGL